VDGQTRPHRRQVILDRVRLLMEHYPSFFAANGAYTEFGRSLAYKFARLGAPIWAYQQGVWPHPTGMLRRLVGNHLRWYADRGVIRGNGTLRQELTSEGSTELRETYISTGSAYWATQAFGALWSLADDDPFWITPEKPLPVEQGDFVRIMPEPGWILVGTQATGEVQRFTAKSGKSPAKYGKYHYTTAAPFNVGLADGFPSPDGMLSLIDQGEVGHRNDTLNSAVGAPGWLRFRYAEVVRGNEHVIETAILVRGNRHLRIHRVTLASGTGGISAIEGAAAFGYAPGDIIQLGTTNEKQRSWAAVRERFRTRYVAIEAIAGYSAAKLPATWRGANDLNSVYGRYVLPALSVDLVSSGQVLICLVTIGDEADREHGQESEVPQVDWNDDDTIAINWMPGARIVIPPLP
jgi:hypothetical protein